MILSIDFDSDEPIYLQIKNEIIKGVAKGKIEEGYELPSVRILAEELGVNMHTVNKSYAMLKDDGYIKMDRRKGAIICFELENSDKRFKNRTNKEVELLVAECINRGISYEDVSKGIEELFKEYNNMNTKGV